jgi:hypothetical protein
MVSVSLCSQELGVAFPLLSLPSTPALPFRLTSHLQAPYLPLVIPSLSHARSFRPLPSLQCPGQCTKHRVLRRRGGKDVRLGVLSRGFHLFHYCFRFMYTAGFPRSPPVPLCFVCFGRCSGHASLWFFVSIPGLCRL